MATLHIAAVRPGRILFGLALLLALVWQARAHEGESHGVAGISASQHYEPRAEAAAGPVELTAIAKAGALWLFVVHRADNSPWPNLAIEIESVGKEGIRAENVAPGVYRAKAEWLEHAGKFPLTFTLQGAGIEELLSANLTISESASQSMFSGALSATAWWVLGGIIVLAGIVAAGWFARRRRA